MEILKQIKVISFYDFIPLKNLNILLAKILYLAKRKYIKGTILIAEEGINGSICGQKKEVDFLMMELTNLTGSKNLNAKVNYCDEQPFDRLKVKIKREIIALAVGDLNINKLKGDYIKPNYWDEFISANDVIVIDTRNKYEIELGTFKNSINPETDNFKQFPLWLSKNKELLEGKKVAMFCTGGIRCEKSTALLKIEGFKEVYHLEGGIIKYLEDTKNKNNLWEGKCFVFDNRQAINDELKPV